MSTALAMGCVHENLRIKFEHNLLSPSPGAGARRWTASSSRTASLPVPSLGGACHQVASDSYPGLGFFLNTSLGTRLVIEVWGAIILPV